MKWIKFIVIISIIFVSISVGNNPMNQQNEKIDRIADEEINAGNGTQYWALIVAVGIYANNPDMNRPSMLTAADNLYKTLLVSPWWNSSHIKVIKGENATVLNIMAGFKWLSDNANENDICLIYLTTHGFPIIFDFPPRDEIDGMDEALAAYRGFLPFPSPWSWEPLANPFGIITDDEINFMLNRINAKGICMIVDSCHSGGFNDNWSYAKGYDMAYEIGSDLKGRNRVVLTSVREDEISYGSLFSNAIINGLEGYADSNNDNLCSAEESFYYARSRILNETKGMHPQMFDDYLGELILTQIEMPPSIPKLSGNETGKTNVSNVYHIVSSDPENDKIKYKIDWGNGIEETNYFNSGECIELHHSWEKEGTYTIKARAIDEYGAESEWNDSTVVTMAYPYHKVDQRQVERGYAYLLNDTRWLAQSFIPNVSKIDKIDLGLISWQEGYDVILQLKDSLNGNVLAEDFEKINPSSNWATWTTQWISFNIKANLTLGREYYIVCHSSKPGWGVAWVTSENDAYKNGVFYNSYNGNNWNSLSIDACFVTYGQ